MPTPTTTRLATVTIGLLALTAGVVNGADLTLREQATPTGSLVRLGDVADIASADTAERERLARLPLMPAPAPGTRSLVTAQGVRELIVAAGVDLNTVRFNGAIRIVIGDAPALAPASRRTFVETTTTPRDPVFERPFTKQPVTKQPVEKRPVTKRPLTKRPRRVTLSHRQIQTLTNNLRLQILDTVSRSFGSEMIEVTLPPLEKRHLRSLSLAKSTPVITSAAPIVAGANPFRVSFQTDDDYQSEEGTAQFEVTAEVRPARPAVFAVRAVPRGSVITRADVAVQPLTADTRVPSGVFVLDSLDEVVGQEAGVNLRPGVLLTDANCLPPMLVRRGDEVTVRAGGGGVTIRLTARARANGRLGEVISVETYEKNERISARVAGRRELAVLSADPGAGEFSTAVVRNRVAARNRSSNLPVLR